MPAISTLAPRTLGKTPLKLWWKLPFLFGLLYLAGVRDELFANNLFDSYNADDYPTATCTAADVFARKLDGTCNDLDKPAMGSLGYRFGRNVPLDKAFADESKLFSPNPRTIGQKLLVRDTFKPAKTLN
ncbi:hypothetical protein HK104_009448, partial [Borealophlyctis nickersoniae]